MRTIFVLLVTAVLVVAGWLAWSLFVPLSPGGQKFVLLRPGYSSRKIASELKSAGVIRSADAFLLWHYWHHKGRLKAGEYYFDTAANEVTVHDRLVRGDIYVHSVVIPEGYTLFDIAQLMQDAGLGSKEEFLNAAQSQAALIHDIDPEARTLEGYLFPNTYHFTHTQTMQDMIAIMVREFRQVAQQIGLNSDVHTIVTMASIVEKETAVPEERPIVASVYYNRLGKRIALDADPSVIYAKLLQGSYQGALHHADMQVESPYNTYRHAGLPPGPIANPGKSALEAAMHPANTNYYFFVSNGNGHHRFASSLEEHNRNVAEYRKLMRGQ
ncbi:MAG TPA: endolytic transglycosylase MltG [Terriglobales bacterium]|nr:endolytic transglycosylase MltG [Terriglobales bacterium]